MYNPNFNVTLITKNSNTLMSVIMVKIVASSSTTNRRFGIDPNDLADVWHIVLSKVKVLCISADYRHSGHASLFISHEKNRVATPRISLVGLSRKIPNDHIMDYNDDGKHMCGFGNILNLIVTLRSILTVRDVSSPKNVI